MFNDIGKSSEGFINTALSGVSFLVENYKPLGAAILALAGTYGTYKAALVIVSAVEKAHAKVVAQATLAKQAAAAQNVVLANSDAMAAARKTLFTNALKVNTKAVRANTKAWFANPAVLITGALVILCATIYAVSKALNTQARAQEAVNKKQQEQQEMRDKEKSESRQQYRPFSRKRQAYLRQSSRIRAAEKVNARTHQPVRPSGNSSDGLFKGAERNQQCFERQGVFASQAECNRCTDARR